MEYPSLDKPKAGAFRFNTDSSQLEIYDGNQWTGVLSTSPEQHTGGARGLFAGGRESAPAFSNLIEYINIATTGNAVDYGDLTRQLGSSASCSYITRGVFFAGQQPAPASYGDQIDYVTIASTGNAVDWGVNMSNVIGPDGFGNETRAIVATGSSNSTDWDDTIDYVTIASTGNGVDFGNTIAGSGGCQATSSTTRGILLGFTLAPNYTYTNRIDFVTIATTGNATDFGGDMLWGGNGRSCSNGIRSVSSSSTPSATTALQTGFIASRGNFIEYGDLASTNDGGGSFATSDTTRGVFGIMAPGSSNVMEYISMSTSGKAVDFGDLTQEIRNSGATSNAHGGL